MRDHHVVQLRYQVVIRSSYYPYHFPEVFSLVSGVIFTIVTIIMYVRGTRYHLSCTRCCLSSINRTLYDALVMKDAQRQPVDVNSTPP